MQTTLYSAADVRRHLSLGVARDVVETTYLEAAQGRVLNPSKLTMRLGDDGAWPDRNAFAIDMPAYVGWLDVAGMKWAVATWDAATDHPISAQILLFDLDRGAFTAVLEGMYLTGVRTALQSVVGLRHLAPGPVASVGVFGAGFQGKFQLRVIDALLEVEEFRLFDPDAERARALSAAVEAEMAADVAVTDAPTAAATDAVVTVTDAKTPVLEEAWLAEDALIVALGTYRELAAETVRAATHVVVDHVEQCLQRGSLAALAERDRFDAADIDATIGEVLDGAYDHSIAAADRVVFVPIGLGALDVAIAEHLHQTQRDNDDLQAFAFDATAGDRP
ncbi:MAG: ornithine cyclodeaminase family protein [Haloferacaceae archaeon]